MKAAAAWLLITVTYGGAVNRSPAFLSRATCDEAASLALTGMTIEANKKADAEYEARESAAAATQLEQWRRTHPPRKPTKAEVRRWTLANGSVIMGSSGPYSRIEADGLIYDYPGSLRMTMGPSYDPNKGEAAVLVRGNYVMKYAADNKVAECVETVECKRAARGR